eukprot:CAMPEP_0201575682 /NCGR_PEP_ID=MMETSP0190_2-20130828/21045_1 /ASSEMBLY_ACC=CAM_ASM_000263 /TAXON_ID=37353 /ORGANISM="Rosalina sp." /LENGTH=110 /DNA_ID=CAMNT_0048005623 /DNA_START=51 /DNA_END=383 /DNA_ORIENTATION=+
MVIDELELWEQKTNEGDRVSPAPSPTNKEERNGNDLNINTSVDHDYDQENRLEEGVDEKSQNIIEDTLTYETNDLSSKHGHTQKARTFTMDMAIVNQPSDLMEDITAEQE